MSDRPIYFDNHATTQPDPEVVSAMVAYLSDDFGNASSRTHEYGEVAARAIEKARVHVASLVAARRPSEIIFTSGATESNNLAILGAANARQSRGGHVITSIIEHPAVLECCRALRSRGIDVTELTVDACGRVNPRDVERAIRPDTFLVSIMAANNEIGVIQPIEEIGRICHRNNVLFHSDAAQLAAWKAIDVSDWMVDMLSLSSHKMYGPKGVGALYVREEITPSRLVAIQFGGGHERGLRPGTLPVHQIVGMGKAAELALDEINNGCAQAVEHLRDKLWREISTRAERLRCNALAAERLPNNLSVTFEGVDGDDLLRLIRPYIAISFGSACQSAKSEVSHVLRAIGLSDALAKSTIRFGLGRHTSVSDVDRAVDVVVKAAAFLGLACRADG